MQNSVLLQAQAAKSTAIEPVNSRTKMQKQLRVCILLSLLLVLGVTVDAQNYNTGIGIRAGLSNGLTIKHFIGNSRAIEGIFASRWHGWNFTGLYEIHAQAFGVSGLNWYYGLGGHIGYWSNKKPHPWFDDDDSHSVIGVDGILGMEYVIKEIPFSFSLDWKPGFNFVGYTGFWADEFAFSVRYVF